MKLGPRCPTCGALAEEPFDGVRITNHAPLCGEVQQLSRRVEELAEVAERCATALVTAGLLAEFRP